MILYESRFEEAYASRRKTLSCQLHLHHEIEFCYMAEGSTTVWADEKKYKASAGDLILFFPNQIHGFENDDNVNAILFILSPDDFHDYLTLFRNYKLICPVVTPRNTKEVKSAFNKAYDISKKIGSEPFAAEMMRGYLSVALASLFSVSAPIADSNNDLSSMQKILLYCDTHYNEQLSLVTLEKKLGLSRYYISHIFYDKIKIGFSDYVNLLRINAAKSMLKHSDKIITDIAFDSGFTSIRTFNRQFVNICGFTPAEYRKRYIEKLPTNENSISITHDK